MKSSPNLIRSGETRLAVNAWTPAELAIPLTDTAPLPPVEEIVAILGSLNPFAKEKGLAKTSGLVQPAHAQVHAWTPGEIVPRPPAVFANANVMDAELAWNDTVDDSQEETDAYDEAAGQAAGILEDANQQAEQILAEARRQAAAIEAEARQAGLAAAHAEAAQGLETVQNIVQETIAWRERVFAESENDMVELVQSVARAMFWEGFTLESDDLRRTLNRVVEEARSLGDLRIYLNPADAANLDPYWREAQMNMLGSQVQVVSSEGVRQGGCFINGQWGSVDARIETQLQVVLDAMRQTPEIEGALG